MAKAGAIDCARITRITVDTYRLAASKSQKNVAGSFGAKFSIPFAAATILYHGRSRLEAFSDAAVANRAINALAQKVDITENADYSAAYPREQICDLVVYLDDGTSLCGRCTTTKGESSNPVTEAELVRKFHELGDPIWGKEVTAKLRGALCDIDGVDDLGKIADQFLL